MVGRITLGSLFDGIGGFPLCAALSGITPLWAAEIEPACIAVTKQHFPDMLHFGDISQINGAEIPPVDIITFGSPCQDVSVAGKRAGIKHKDNGDDETTRSGLFFEAIRIIYEMRRATNGKYPTFIVWENVPGAFNSHNGNDFRTVLKEITKTDIPMPASGKWANAGVVRGGAICAAWRLLDAQYWGVPQRRKRIYLVGSFGSNCAEEILFKRDSVRRYLTPRGTQGQAASRNIGTGVTGCNYIFDCRGNGDGITAPTITGAHNSRVTDYSAVVLQSAGFLDRAPAEAYSIGYEEEKTPPVIKSKYTNVLCLNDQGGSSITIETGKQSPMLRAQTHGNLPIVVYCPQGSMIGRKDKNGPQGNGINKNVSFTVNTTDRHAVVYALDRASFNQGINAKYDFEITDSGINLTIVAKGPSAVAYEAIIDEIIEWIVRRLTPLECERLQGYPDYWTVLRKIDDMTEEEYEFFKGAFLLDKKIRGKVVKNIPNKKQILKWYNKLDCDGTRYKQTGNSLAIPCALRVIGYIADYIRKRVEK